MKSTEEAGKKESAAEDEVKGVNSLATVELGDFGAEKETEVRYLMGRMRLTLFTIPAYIFDTIGLGTSLYYVINKVEWSIIVVILAWIIAVTWIWMYSISYRYRRKINNIYSLIIFVLYSAVLSYICFERSLPQKIYNGETLVEQDFSFSLVISGIAASTACLVIFVHAIYFGRGYRERKDNVNIIK